MLALKKHFKVMILITCRSDTESAEDTTVGKDETDDKTNGNEEKKEEKKAGMVSRVTNLLSAMKKTVKKPKDSIKYTAETPESEMKVIFDVIH